MGQVYINIQVQRLRHRGDSLQDFLPETHKILSHAKCSCNAEQVFGMCPFCSINCTQSPKDI